jgi:hypothetical protein
MVNDGCEHIVVIYFRDVQSNRLRFNQCPENELGGILAVGKLCTLSGQWMCGRWEGAGERDLQKAMRSHLVSLRWKCGQCEACVVKASGEPEQDK